MNQKILNIFVVVLLIGIVGVSSLTVVQQLNYQNLDSQYQGLLTDYETLSSEWDQTSEDLNDLQSSYLVLLEDYASLNEVYLIVLSNNTDLQEQYDQLLVDFALLNASFVDLEQNYADLQADYAQLQSDYTGLQVSYNALMLAYATLELQYDTLVFDYNVLLNDYNSLAEDFLALQSDYDSLELSYNTLATWIRQQTLPAQYMVFAEAVRRYYFEDFYVQNKWAEGNISGYWAEFTRFCRDLILHDSQIGYSPLEGSWFPDVSNALTDCLRYGNQTEYLAYRIFWDVFYGYVDPWLPYWGGWANTVDPLYDIARYVQWCVDNIIYEHDSEITLNREFYDWDYIKFPVETAFRTMGDCEDQAIFTAAHLESCGFETVMATFHDAEYMNGTGFYHGVLLVQIEDPSEFWNRYPSCSLWTIGSVDPEGRIWSWLDTTWNTPFGTEPAWLSYYKTNGMTYDDVTFAICDLDGSISYVSGVGLGIHIP